MTTKLIYHQLNEDISPFDKTIGSIAENNEISITCPYLSLNYLQEHIINLANSWRLITDVAEWLKSNNKTEQLKIRNFINQNIQSIHHCKDLHAKVLINNEKALIGSANFTQKGIKNRVEMSVTIEEQTLIQELQNWFEQLWLETASPEILEIDEFIDQLPTEIEYNKTLKLIIKSRSKPINAKLTVKTKKENKIEIHQRLVEQVKLFETRQQCEEYLDLMKMVIEISGLAIDDPRMVTSIPKSNFKKTKRILPLTINYRYILCPHNLLPVLIYGYEDYLKQQLNNEIIFRFDSLRNEKEHPPLGILFDNTNTIYKEIENIKKAIQKEVFRAKRSPFYGHHEPLVYQAATDLVYRKDLLNEAFKK
ncbi:MAG: hypothetical protein RIT27_1923 [Pseudomonadota bacterium]|jgi:hypothetical protein